MDVVLAGARGVHYAAATLAFGTLAFVFVVARPSWRGVVAAEKSRAIETRLIALALTGAAVAVASAVVWFGAQTAAIVGVPFACAFERPTVATMLGHTLFGRVWMLRGILLIALVVLLVAARRGEKARAMLLAAATMAAATALGALAWAGHAAAAEGANGTVQRIADTVHLLAAGGWLGALPGLVWLLGAEASDIGAPATRRFSTLGVAAVSALTLSGIVNAWYLVGNVPALVGTPYGRLLAAKLALFVAMLALAAVNRFRLTPRVAEANGPALERLRRNAVLEAAAGLGVLALVAVLGITVPAIHETPVWPLAYTVDLARFDGRPFSMVVEPAYPTTYASSPLPYDVATVESGAELYTRHCAACHGAGGHGDGALATMLPAKVPDLTVHAARHRPGDLYWWIAHGKPGTPMPPFTPALAANDIWRLVGFLQFLGDAPEATELGRHVDTERGVPAPDFTFEIAGGPQQALREAGGSAATLIVLYSLPDSAPRLRELAASAPALAAAGVRTVALPLDAPAPSEPTTRAFSAVADPGVPPLYAKLARAEGGEGIARHAELLVDRLGYLRARWLGVPGTAVDRSTEIRQEAEALRRAPPLTGRPRHH